MGSVALRVSAFYLLFLCVSSGLGATEDPPPESTQLIHKICNGDKVSISTSLSALQRDTIPIIIPTTPSTTTPIVNPSLTPPSPGISSPTVVTPTTPATTPTTPTTSPPTTSSGGTWCISSPGASQTALQVALDYACGYGGADCSAIQSGGSCYDSNTVQDHASYAFNDYYQKNPVPTSCAFGGAAQLSNTDPSHGNCHFASSKKSSPATPTPVTPTPVTTTPIVPSPPSPVYVTPTPTEPGGSSVYGVAEPTGLPSSANIATCNLSIIVIMIALILAADHI